MRWADTALLLSWLENSEPSLNVVIVLFLQSCSAMLRLLLAGGLHTGASPCDGSGHIYAAAGRQAGAAVGVSVHVGVLREVGERGRLSRDAGRLC